MTEAEQLAAIDQIIDMALDESGDSNRFREFLWLHLMRFGTMFGEFLDMVLLRAQQRMGN